MTTRKGIELTCKAVCQSRMKYAVMVYHPVPIDQAEIVHTPTSHRLSGGDNSMGKVYDAKHEKKKPIIVPHIKNILRLNAKIIPDRPFFRFLVISRLTLVGRSIVNF